MTRVKFRSIRSRIACIACIATALCGAHAFAAEDKAAVEKETASKSSDEQGEKSQAEIERKLEAAQKRLDAAAREVAELSMSLSERIVPHVHALTMRPPKAMLGVNLGPGDEDGPDDGVGIASVSPGGAAEAAGLKADDVLLEVNGQSLKRDRDRSPRRKLLSIMRDVEPGEKVTVRYRRDGKTAAATIVAREAEDRVFARALLPERGARFESFEPFAFMHADGVFGSAELVAMTPRLGEYFGTDKGLLVVRAPEDARLQLEEGDVILDIDGRAPKSPSHAMRILASYQPGEKLKLNILRARKRLTFDVTIPEKTRESHVGRLGSPLIIEGSVRPATPIVAPRPPAPPIPAAPHAATDAV